MSNSRHPFVKNVQNFTIVAILFILMIAFFFYITGILVIFSVNGDLKYITQYLGLSLDNQFVYIYTALLSYWTFYITNSSNLATGSYDYFAIKLWASSLFPSAFLVILIKTLWSPLMEYLDLPSNIKQNKSNEEQS